MLRCLSVHVHGECLNHAAIDTVEFFDLQGEASCLLVDLFDGSHLLADAFEVEVVGFVDGSECSVEVFHFLAVACEFCALLVHLLEGVGEGAQFLNVFLCGCFHLGREGGLCAAQEFVVGGADDGSQTLCFVFEGFCSFGCVEGDGLAGCFHGVGSHGCGRCFGRGCFSGLRGRRAAHDDDRTAGSARISSDKGFAAADDSAATDGCDVRHRSVFVFGKFFFVFRKIFAVFESQACFDFLIGFIVVRQFFPDFGFVEGTVKCREEEHHDFRSHADEEHDVAARQVGQFEERTEDNDGGTPRVGIVQEGLSRHAVHPVLQADDDVYFSCHLS